MTERIEEGRPLHEEDILARNFPDVFTTKVPLWQFKGILDLTDYAKPAGFSGVRGPWGWSPQIKKGRDRWVVVTGRYEMHEFGIDALRIGLKHPIDNFDRSIKVIPYFHFRKFKLDRPFTPERKHGVAWASLIFMRDWQWKELKSLVDSVK